MAVGREDGDGAVVASSTHRSRLWSSDRDKQKKHRRKRKTPQISHFDLKTKKVEETTTWVRGLALEMGSQLKWKYETFVAWTQASCSKYNSHLYFCFFSHRLVSPREELSTSQLPVNHAPDPIKLIYDQLQREYEMKWDDQRLSKHALASWNESPNRKRSET